MKGMEIMQTNCSSGYAGKPPWIFKGSALYQFHLVKAEVARAIIPKEFKLVETFGYTAGGFYLANYTESPFGPFNELVTIAGIVRTTRMPTSHAWAASVYVNNDNACMHGRKEFGIPSQVATFSKVESQMIHVAENDGPVTTSLYDIRLQPPILKMNPLKWMALGPTVKMSLPGYSGRTEHVPQLLKYTCQIECRVKPTSPARISGSLGRIDTENEELNECLKKREMGMSVMLSKPILALEFNCLKMEVHRPVVVSDHPLEPKQNRQSDTKMATGSNN
ncbi:putative acetoacetate decarboxylase, protein NEOXANTHIN-DEFICIENT 1 [Helianthus annuus]|uniref:Acetoacetate decarboxylase, protein NEOXANTHIN-DEFICIENT 1 n=1 Tax=Helianthus annuus TaxID=4232 RepID=A0A251U2Q5_HELAN|nr:protein NEOXANTHIN-DEFICIENT 1 [Helianthus annuus]KAF5793792.1 putative acetoacetate decarboxylase, protein NEOXANTHIN-DEFICIENT 1 [Helianthus annuus]